MVDQLVHEQELGSPSLGSLIKTLLPSLIRWLNPYIPVEISYHLAQLLSSHGCFNKFLYKIHKIPSSSCAYCGCEVDDVIHIIFDCHIWDEHRSPLSSLLGQ